MIVSPNIVDTAKSEILEVGDIAEPKQGSVTAESDSRNLLKMECYPFTAESKLNGVINPAESKISGVIDITEPFWTLPSLFLKILNALIFFKGISGESKQGKLNY